MDQPTTAHTTAFQLQDRPYLPYPATTKAHRTHNPPQHATQTQHPPCTPQRLHITLADHAYHTELQQSCSHPQHNNMHYTPSTTHPPAFHVKDNLPVHTSNKHKAQLAN